MTTSKLRLLTIGSYSDYTVLGVFDEDHKDEADRIAELIGGDVSDESFDLNEFSHDEPPIGKEMYLVFMDKSGNAQCQHRPRLTEDGLKHRMRYQLRTHETNPYRDKQFWELSVMVYADSGQHAIKIANELRGHILAGAAPERNDNWNCEARGDD